MAGLAKHRDLIAALSAAVTAVSTVMLWWVTSDYVTVTTRIFEAQQLPIVLMDAPGIVHNDPVRHILGFSMDVKNYGSGLAHQTQGSCTDFFNGSVSPEGKRQAEPVLIPPHERMNMGFGEARGEPYTELMTGKKSWEKVCDVTFHDFNNRRYQFHARFKFIPPFMSAVNPSFIIIEEWCKDDKGRECGHPE